MPSTMLCTSLHLFCLTDSLQFKCPNSFLCHHYLSPTLKNLKSILYKTPLIPPPSSYLLFNLQILPTSPSESQSSSLVKSPSLPLLLKKHHLIALPKDQFPEEQTSQQPFQERVVLLPQSPCNLDGNEKCISLAIPKYFQTFLFLTFLKALSFKSYFIRVYYLLIFIIAVCNESLCHFFMVLVPI